MNFITFGGVASAHFCVDQSIWKTVNEKGKPLDKGIWG